MNSICLGKIGDMPLKRWTSRLDRILLHPVLGLPIFFAAMHLIFQAIYSCWYAHTRMGCFNSTW